MKTHAHVPEGRRERVTIWTEEGSTLCIWRAAASCSNAISPTMPCTLCHPHCTACRYLRETRATRRVLCANTGKCACCARLVRHSGKRSHKAPLT